MSGANQIPGGKTLRGLADVELRSIHHIRWWHSTRVVECQPIEGMCHSCVM